MKRIALLISMVVMGLFMGFEANASHVAGGSIRYDYLGLGSTANTYRYKITVNVIRDCTGIPYSTAGLNGNERLWARCPSTGTTLGPFTLTWVQYVPKPGERTNARGAKDISDVCRNVQTSCETSTRTPNGYEMFSLEYTIDLPRCNSWEFRYATYDCCRNGVQNFTGGGYGALETSINTAWSPWTNPGGAPANSAPIFADEAKPMPSACTGQNVFYGIGTYDPDGDSLRFELTCPWAASTRGTTNPFNTMSRMSPRSPHSCARPIDNLTLDSANGLISFRTNTSGKYIVAFYVLEYERCTGILKGKTYREVQFTVDACSNNVPRDISGISELKGNAKKLGKYSLEVCEGEVISWQDTIFDQDLTDTLYFASNVDSVLDGVKFTQQSITRNRAVIKFEWRARLSGGQYKTFFVNFDDDRCNYPGNGFSIFDITVRPAASAGPDQYICLGDTSHLDALGGSSFVWHRISGDQILPGVNWFPDTTAVDTNRTVRFIPSQTTVLWVEVDTLRDACGNLTIANCFTTDTIVIFVPDSFSLTTVPDFFLCNPGEGQLGVTASQSAFNYSYQWEPSGFLDYDTLRDPNFSGVRFPETFGVTVTSDSGCVREASVDVNVTDPFPQNMQAFASDTLVCLQKTIDLWVDKGSIDYGGCDTVTYRCQGTYKDLTMGAGAVTNNTSGFNMPMTYPSNAYSVRSQYLYLASDLQAMGMKAGPIKSIGWEISSLYNSTSAPINGFTIKIGCSQIADMPRTGFVNGLRTVYSPRSVFPNAGWNMYNFDTEYVWDGTSNLIVEICWENGTTRLFGNHIQTFDNTSYRSASSYFQTSTFAGAACGNNQLSGGFPNSSLPRTRFNVCSGMRSSLFKFDWDPKSTGGFVGATNRDSVQASVNLSTSGKYFVYIEDSAYGVCHDTLEVDVNVVSSYDVKPDSLPAQCFKNGFIQLTSPTPFNITNPGGKWSGSGIINDTLGIWDPIQSGMGKFWVVYEVTGDACAATDSVEIEIVGLPDPSILGPDSLCELYGGVGIDIRHELLPVNPGGYFTGYGVDSALVGGKMTYWVDGTKFNPSTGSPDTVTFTYTLFDGCLHDSTFKVPVVAQWDSTFLGTMEYGNPYYTVNFCMTSDILDTLVVAGDNPVWSFVGTPSAMLDRNIGVFDAKVGAGGQFEPFIDTIVVGNYGFCGTENRIPVFMNRAPQIEIIPKAYCYDFISDPDNRFINDTIRFRIPKGPNNGGSGQRALGGLGNDTTVWYGSIGQTGWSNAYDGVADQYNFNFWDGNPWMTFPNIARFRPASFASSPGNKTIRYQYAMKYRDNHPTYNLCYSRDSAEIFISPRLDDPAGDLLAFCEGDSIGGFTTSNNYGVGYETQWFSSKNGTPVAIGDTLVYDASLDNTAGNKEVYAQYVHIASGCRSGQNGSYGTIPYRVTTYPSPLFNTIPDNDTTAKFEGSLVTFTNQTEYSDTGVTFEWRYDDSESGSFVDQVVPHNLGDANSTIQVKYNLFGFPCTELYAINEVGCADSTKWCFGIDKTVRLAWPNVFTPGEDGFNDWWFVLSSNGDQAIPFPTPCVGPNGNHVFCEEGEAAIKEWYEASFEKFEGFIYDRWGRKVFTITRDEPIWKGENNSGAVQTDGVYMYSIRWKPKGLGTEEEVQEGTITLIRESK